MSWQRKITIEGGDAFIRREVRRLHYQENGDFYRDPPFWIGVGLGIAIAMVTVAVLSWLGVPV